MEINFYNKDLSELQIEGLNEYVMKKIPSIEKLLTKNFQDYNPLLVVKAQRFEKHDAFEVEFVLSLPSKNIVAAETSHTLNKAVDLAKDRLITMIKKHLDLQREV